MMSFGEAIRVCLKEKFATFSGRACRSEYWWFVLFNFLIGVVASILDAVLGTEILLGTDRYGNPKILGIITTIVALGLLVPWFAVYFRRLHDRNKSGWYGFLPLILIGLVVGGLISIAFPLLLVVGAVNLFTKLT